MLLKDLIEESLLRRPRHIEAGALGCARVAHTNVVDNSRWLLRQEIAATSRRAGSSSRLAAPLPSHPARSMPILCHTLAERAAKYLDAHGALDELVELTNFISDLEQRATRVREYEELTTHYKQRVPHFVRRASLVTLSAQESVSRPLCQRS
jgi:hypothetical protein